MIDLAQQLADFTRARAILDDDGAAAALAFIAPRETRMREPGEDDDMPAGMITLGDALDRLALGLDRRVAPASTTTPPPSERFADVLSRIEAWTRSEIIRERERFRRLRRAGVDDVADATRGLMLAGHIEWVTQAIQQEER